MSEPTPAIRPWEQVLEEVQLNYLRGAILLHNGNVTAVSRTTKIAKRSLDRMISRHGLRDFALNLRLEKGLHQ